MKVSIKNRCTEAVRVISGVQPSRSDSACLREYLFRTTSRITEYLVQNDPIPQKSKL